MDKITDEWSKRTVLDAKSGRAYNDYYYKRKKAVRIELKSPKAKVLAGYVLIDKDLRSAIFWLEQIVKIMSSDENFTDSKGHVKATYDREKFNLVKGLFVAALTFYGKSFATCEGRRVKLEKKNLGEEFWSDHDLAIRFRNNFAAHSGAEKLEEVAVVVAVPIKKGVLPYMAKELKQPDTITHSGILRFLKLFNHARDFAVNKVETIEQKIFKEEVIAKGAAYWASKA